MAGIEDEDFDVFEPADDMSQPTPSTRHHPLYSLRHELTESKDHFIIV